jgi:hypothetical protein
MTDQLRRPPGDQPRETSEATTPGVRSSSDARALALLAGLIAVVAWHAWHVDAWLANFDVLMFYLPWYAELGQRLREFDIPGWTTHLISGTPFAGDPQSGWMYVPAMLCFALLPAVAALKAMVVLQLGIAALSTYAFGRVLGFGPVAALVAAVVYAFGPFLQWNTYGITIFGQLATWIPLALLGVELAVRARFWRDRIVPWFAAGFAVSQMLAGWLGQGAMYGLLVVLSYLVYRAVIASPVPGRGGLDRLMVAEATGIAVLCLGLALGAAGLLPRLAVNAETNLAGGDYEALGVAGATYTFWPLDTLVYRVMASGYRPRTTATWGGAALALVLLAPVLARRRFAAPYFVVLGLLALILVQSETALHRLFYLIPRFRVLHQHDPWHVLTVVPIATALLSGATVEALARWQGRRRLLPVVGLVYLFLLVVAEVVRRSTEFVGWPTLIAAATTLVLIAHVVATPRNEPNGSRPRGPATWVPALILAIAFVQPMGLEITGAWLGWPRDATWAPFWSAIPARDQAVAANVARADPGGAGEFLQARLAGSGPFRYVGYGGFAYPGDEERGRSYMTRRLDPNVSALLVNGRPIFLGLDEIQGYNPVQLTRYAEFMTALNGGEPTNYHIAYLLPSGVDSPLLDLLSLRYVVVDASLPEERDDIVALTAGRREVFRTERVVVYESDPAPDHAWIVHDVRAVERGEALPLLASGDVDPKRTALVEGSPPAVAAPADPAAESARVTRYEPDEIAIATTAGAPGLLVVSEIYADGWRAYVDGRRVEILPTDYILRGVPIPAGAHTVELRYEPLSLRVGLPISAVTTLAMLAVFAAAGWSRLRRYSPAVRSGFRAPEGEGAGRQAENGAAEDDGQVEEDSGVLQTVPAHHDPVEGLEGVRQGQDAGDDLQPARQLLERDQQTGEEDLGQDDRR